MKIFAQRACHIMWRKKHIDVEDKCCFCHQPNESLVYSLFDYPDIHTWQCSYLPLISAIEQLTSIKDLACWIAEKGNSEDLAKFLCIAQDLCDRQNKMMYKHTNFDPMMVIEREHLLLRKVIKNILLNYTKQPLGLLETYT